MKKYLFWLYAIIIIFTLYWKFLNSKQNYLNSGVVSTSQKHTPIPSPVVKFTSVTLHDITYEYAQFTAYQDSRIILIPNFTEKLLSNDIITTHQCKAAINGGFYDPQNKPLGLFYSSTYTHQAVDSSLINGFLTLSPRFDISRTTPQSTSIALQSGPLLMEGGSALPLKIRNDEHARRMVAGITQQRNLVFITVFIHNSINQGPQLVDLPEIISAINSTLSDPLIIAINLDGGSASMFKNSDIYINEIFPIGSIICLQ